MVCHDLFKAKLHVLWSILLGATFVSCSLLIYHTLLYNGRMCYSAKGCPSSTKQKAKLSSEKCKPVCSTPDCVEIANTMMGYMNLSADPCDDFYIYVCGNYQEEYGPRNNKSLFSSLHQQLYRKIRGIIESSKETHYSDSAAQKLKTVYDSCINIEFSELTILQSIQLLFNEIGIKNWPHLDSNFTFLNPTLEDALGRSISLQQDLFVSFVPSWNDKTEVETTGDLYNFTVEIPIDSHYGCSEDEEVKRMLPVLLGSVGMDYDEINSIWNAFMAVNKGLHELELNSTIESEYCDPVYERFFEYIKCNEGYSHNTNILCKILDSVVTHGRLSHHVTTTRMLMACTAAHYMKELSNFLNRYSHRSIAHYIAVKILLKNQEFLNFPIRKKLRDCVPRLQEKLAGYVKELNRWKYCVSWIAKNMPMALGVMYVYEVFPQEILDDVENIVDEFKKATSKLLQGQEQISEHARSRILKQIESIRNDVIDKFAISVFRNRTVVNEAFRNFHPLRNNFLLNVMENNKRVFTAMHSETTLGGEKFYNQYFQANAVGYNGIQLFFGILLPPVYKFTYPKLLNIANTGKVIGHEIGHVLYYRLKEVIGKDNQTGHYFKENNRCRIEQFSNFEMKRIGQQVRGDFTVGENFADAVGNEVSELVSENFLSNTTEKIFSLPGLPFTPEQIFYIHSSQFYCAVSSDELLREMLERDTHSPKEFRIKGALQNSERFSRAFNCPKSSFMNPEKKCTVFL